MGDGKQKNFTIIGVASLLLVAAVVGTITYRAYHGEGAGGGEGSDKVQTSSKAVEAMCQPTNYKETCVKSLDGAKNTSDPKELIKVALQSTVDSVGETIKSSALLKEAAKNPRTSKAFDSCKGHFENSIDEIKRSSDQLDTFDLAKFDDYILQIRTWLSASITYQQTCLAEFEDINDDETGKKMSDLLQNTSELSSNGLAMVTELSEIMKQLKIPGFSRRLLSAEERDDDIPGFVSDTARRLLQENPVPDAVVAQDGSGKFKTITEAIATIPKKNNKTFVILVKEGVYKEIVEIPKRVNNVVLIGEGALKTKITGRLNNKDGVGTFQSATVAVNGENFIAKDITIENTAGAEKGQAVALRVSADMAAFYNVQMDGFQDTLYPHSGRQFYRDCTISGTIDYIFGDGAAVFQNCKMIIRRPMEGQDCMLTAQGRKEANGVGGIIIQNSEITAEPEFYKMNPPRKAFLGRPWRPFARTIVMQSFIDRAIAPEGWSPWQPGSNAGLDTIYYGEYLNKGPGSDTSKRVTWPGIKKITPEIALTFTVQQYLYNSTDWIKPTGVPYDVSLANN